MGIKEKRNQILQDYSSYANELRFDQTIPDEKRAEMLHKYRIEVTIEELVKLEQECGSLGHVNIETIYRDDDVNSSYFICDNCRGLVELQ